MTTINEIIQLQKDIATRVLRILQDIDPNAYVAGGAPRNWDEGKPANDIDVCFSTKCFGVALAEKLQDVGMEIEKVQTNENLPEKYATNPHLLGVYSLHYCGQKVQLLHIDGLTAEKNVFSFPVNLCQICWTPLAGNVTSWGYDMGRKYKLAWTENKTYNEIYIGKIMSYYPDYRWFPSCESAVRAACAMEQKNFQ